MKSTSGLATLTHINMDPWKKSSKPLIIIENFIYKANKNQPMSTLHDSSYIKSCKIGTLERESYFPINLKCSFISDVTHNSNDIHT